MSATQASKRLMDSKMCMGYSNHMPFIILILNNTIKFSCNEFVKCY